MFAERRAPCVSDTWQVSGRRWSLLSYRYHVSHIPAISRGDEPASDEPAGDGARWAPNTTFLLYLRLLELLNPPSMISVEL